LQLKEEREHQVCDRQGPITQIVEKKRKKQFCIEGRKERSNRQLLLHAIEGEEDREKESS